MEQFIKNLALGAGKILRDGFSKPLNIKEKSADWDLVTQFDLASEKYIVDKIHKKYSSHAIFSEEQGQTGKGKNLWIIDPLDGTRGFKKRLNSFA